MIRRVLFGHGRQFTKSQSPWRRRGMATGADDSIIDRSFDAIEGSLSERGLPLEKIEGKEVEDEGYEQSGAAAQPAKARPKYVQQMDQQALTRKRLLADGTDLWYANEQEQKRLTSHLGTTLAPFYKPHQLLANPPRPHEITLELLLASQAHLGHHTARWNPANSQYIFGIRGGIHIISLEATASHLRRACRVVSGVAERGGLILFAGTRKGQEACVVRAAQLAGAYHLFLKWRPGSITNGPVLLRNCRKVLLDQYDREIDISRQQLDKMPFLKPDLVVCLNPLENWVLLHECALNNIPTIGVIDTNANPTWVTYPIPANDDSLRCVQVIAGALGRAGAEGQALRKEAALQGKTTYNPTKLPAGATGETVIDDDFAKTGILGPKLQAEALEREKYAYGQKKQDAPKSEDSQQSGRRSEELSADADAFQADPDLANRPQRRKGAARDPEDDYE